ncbi:MAG: response regulator transcription factor [Bacilli bacterium]
MDYLIYSIEDDEDIRRLIKLALSKSNFLVKSFPDGESFFEELEKEKPNMILLDMMLPGISGSEILKKLRSHKKYDDIEIIIVSSNNMLIDKIDGFDLGADDYIEKPFDVMELISRVNAKVRRYKKNRSIIINNISLDLESHTCLKDGVEVLLTLKEFEILSLLFKNKGNVVSRDDLLNQIWGVDQFYETRTIDVHIKSLRSKLEDSHNKLINTVHGIGYKVG